MEATAKLRHLRMSPRKIRLVADLIRGKEVGAALDTLKFLNKKAAIPMKKLLQSAAANAGNKEGMDTESLYVQSITVDEGTMWKRFMPRSRGMAYPILKKTSHINITLKDRVKNAAVSEKVVTEEIKNAVASEQAADQKAETKPKRIVRKKTAATKASADKQD